MSTGPAMDENGVMAACCQYSHSRMECESDCGNCNVCSLNARIAELEAALEAKRSQHAETLGYLEQAYGHIREPAGYVIARIAEVDDDTEGPQLLGFSEDVLSTESAARERHSDAEEWRPGWHIYALTDITEMKG